MSRSVVLSPAILGAAVVVALAACTTGATSPSAPPSAPPSTRAPAASGPASPATEPSGAPSATPTATPPQAAASPELPSFRLVLMGDSMFNGVLGASIEAIGPRLGVNVQVQSWLNPDLGKYAMGGERASDLVARLRTDETLRADIRAADAIWFDVPLGTFADVCGYPTPSTTRAELRSCLPKAVAQNAKDADAMMREIIALRSPKVASIRVLTVWQYFGSTFRDLGSMDLAAAAWRDVRQAVTKSAARYGIDVVDGYASFSGADGLRDALAAGDLMSDEVHLTGGGVTRLVDLFVSSGLRPSA